MNEPNNPTITFDEINAKNYIINKLKLTIAGLPEERIRLNESSQLFWYFEKDGANDTITKEQVDNAIVDLKKQLLIDSEFFQIPLKGYSVIVMPSNNFCVYLNKYSDYRFKRVFHGFKELQSVVELAETYDKADEPMTILLHDSM